MAHTTTVTVEGLTCGDCGAAVRSEVGRLPVAIDEAGYEVVR